MARPGADRYRSHRPGPSFTRDLRWRRRSLVHAEARAFVTSARRKTSPRDQFLSRKTANSLFFLRRSLAPPSRTPTVIGRSSVPRRRSSKVSPKRDEFLSIFSLFFFFAFELSGKFQLRGKVTFVASAPAHFSLKLKEKCPRL